MKADGHPGTPAGTGGGNTPRQPAGVRSGGEFAAASHSEAAVRLARPAEPGSKDLSLAPGEGADFTGLADGTVIERLYVLRSEDGSSHSVRPSTTIDFTTLVPATGFADQAERDTYLHHHAAAIGRFFQDRYGATLDGTGDWSAMRAEGRVTVPGWPLTADQVASAAWHETGIPVLHDEAGSGSLGQALREHIDTTPRRLAGLFRAGSAVRM